MVSILNSMYLKFLKSYGTEKSIKREIEKISSTNKTELLIPVIEILLSKNSSLANWHTTVTDIINDSQLSDKTPIFVEIENIYGTRLIDSSPKAAEKIFLAAFNYAKRNTFISAKLMRNAGLSRLNAIKFIDCPLKKIINSKLAKDYFKISLEEYPGDKKEYKIVLNKLLNSFGQRNVI